MTDFDAITREIAAAASTADATMRGQKIGDAHRAAEVEAQRQRIADIKARAEAARDAEYIPLIEAAKAVQGKWGPHLGRLKRGDDILRLGLKAWKKQLKKGTAQ